MKRNLVISLSVTGLVCLAACGMGELTREVALEAIQKHASESPWTGEIKLDAEASSRNPDFNFLAAVHDPRGRTAYMMGLTAIGDEATLRHRFEKRGAVHEIWGYDLKENAKPFVIEEEGGGTPEGYTLRSIEAVIGQRRPSEILQMTAPAPRLDGVTVSNVTFRWSWELNREIYHAYSWGHPRERVDEEPEEGQATFVLYDDGWGLESVDF